MTATPKTQRDLYESAVIERMKESGFLEVEIRVECLARCDDGYQDEVINAGWHYWNAALTADSGDDEQPRYTTRRLHEEIRKAEERGRQEERECTTSPSEYYKRAAALLEKLRDEIGSGFGEGDIERIGDIVIARLRAWDKLDREDVKRRLSTPPAPSVAVKALEWVENVAEAVTGDYWIVNATQKWLYRSPHVKIAPFDTVEAAKLAAQADYEARIRSALSAQVQYVAEDGERVKAAFNHGYVIACCNITNLHDEPGIAHDTLRELGVTKAEVKKMGLCDYDAKALRDIERARGPNSAVYAAVPAKQEG